MTRTRLYTALLCLLLCGLLLCAPALAEESGDFTIDSNGRLTAYTGTATEVTVPEGVTQIAKTAFYENTAITKVVLPEGVTTIADSAFWGCSALEEISLPQSLTSIGTNCFRGSGLRSVTLPSGLKTISDSAFRDCLQLAEVIIPEGVETIGWYAFRDDPLLESITLPDTVTTLGNYAFSGCTGLKSVTLSNNLPEIGDYAFEGCTSLTEITIPAGVATIGKNVFDQCTALTAVTLNEGLTKLDSYAFARCTSLQTITLPERLEYYGYAVFSGCTGLEAVHAGDHISYMQSPLGYIDNYTSANVYVNRLSTTAVKLGYTKFTDPAYPGLKLNQVQVDENGAYTLTVAECTDKTVTGIVLPPETAVVGSSVFSDCTALTEVTLPEGVTLIDSSAFKNCTALESITLPETLKEIGSSAFYGCIALESIALPQGLETIGSFAFYDCDALQSIVVPDTVTTIDGSAFSRCDSLTKLTLSAGLTAIPDHLCLNSSKLREINIPVGVTSIGEWAFYGCGQLEELVLPEGLESIGDEAFAFCYVLTDITIPNTLTTIGRRIFSASDEVRPKTNYDGPAALLLGQNGYSVMDPRYPEFKLLVTGTEEARVCTLTKCLTDAAELSVPGFVSGVAQYAFLENETLETITFAPGLTTIDQYAFYQCKALRSVTLPEGLTGIGASAFDWCEKLETINLPSTLQTLGERAFNACHNLSSPLTVPVETIEPHTFMSCSSLTSITLTKAVTIGEEAFCGCKTLQELNLPEGLTAIGDEALANCYAITYLKLPSTLTAIGKQAFASCFALANMHLPEGLTTIGELAFDYCSSLTTLTLPESVTRLDKPIGHGYYEDRGIQTVVLPRSITYLPDAAFGDILTTVYCWRGTYGDQWARQYAPIIIYLDDYGPESFTTLTGPEGTLYFDVGDVIDFTPDLLITPRLNTQTYTFYCGSSNSAVAKGSGAKVEMLSPGSAVITMKIRELPGVTCRINVKVGYPVTSFSLPAAVAVKWSDVNAGSDWQLVPANLKPEGANPVMHWVPAAGGSTVTNDIIDGEVYRLTDADYIIAYGHKAFSVTATSRSGVSRTCRVHLYNNITGLRTGLGMNLQVGKTATANVLLLLDGTPVAGLTDLYTLTSSAPGVVKVLADGQLKALKTGTATITAATTDGRYSATFTVKAFKAQQLPAALTEIGPEAFAGSSFAAVMIPDGCTAIGSKAFANCTALERIYIPASVTTIAPDAFDGCHPIICAPAGSVAAAFGAAAGFTVEPY
ncbi:MAG: leucine-rich repeat domain-containing protein [Clostridia bacterium]|nr:leucine-rich repeat domain-containing protein [Clostridia bacterium]